MTKWSVRVRRGPRDPEQLPHGDDALGEAILDKLVTTARKQGLPRPALVALTDASVEQFDLSAVLQAPQPHRSRLLAAMGGRAELDCAAIAGTLQVHRGGRKTRGLVVYVEWPDNRWWTAWHRVDDTGAVSDAEPLVRRAVDGWPRPGGLGGWFARVRREGLRLRLDGPPPAVGQAGLELVH